MDGYVNILKASGYTSSDVVVIVRKTLSKLLGEKVKVGHLGTLDPQAAGVLPIAIGTATKTFDYLIDKKKTYLFGLRLGATTDTLDSYGKVLSKDDKVFYETDIDRVMSCLIGEYGQIPPQFSAKKVNGEKAYDIARRGEKVELKGKKIKVYSLACKQNKPNDFDMEVTCSGGTYVRSIVRDIAEKLDTVGYMSYIVRTNSGCFDISNSVTLDEFLLSPLEYVMPISSVLLSVYGSYELPKNKSNLALNGVKIALDDMPNGLFVLTFENKIVGMAENVNGKLIIRNRL